MSFSEAQVAALSADLQRDKVRHRKQSNRQLSYIEGWWAEAEANRIFGYDGWSTETLEIRCVAENPRKIGQAQADGWTVSYICRVRVTVTTPTGHSVVRDGVGAGHGIDRDLGIAHESAIKEAATDAEKRALKTFGNPFGLALYDKTQAHVSDAAPPGPAANTASGSRRKTAAQAKRDGDHDEIKADIERCDHDGIRDWFTNFDSYTADLPFSWLDPVRDMLERRLSELNGAANTDKRNREMDEAFRNTVGSREAA